MKERICRNLAAAVETMRKACDDAERESKTGDANAVRRVFHILQWGHANASVGIENAMSAVEDAHSIAEHERSIAAEISEVTAGR